MNERYIRRCLLLFSITICFSCGSPSYYSENTLTVSGLVTDFITAEPIRGVKVSLYIDPCIYGNPSEYENISHTRPTLYSTVVTYDDGFYSFASLSIDQSYYICVEKEGYEKAYSQRIQPCFGNTTETVDLQMKTVNPKLNVRTFIPKPDIPKRIVWFDGDVSIYDDEYHKYIPDEYGFVYGYETNPTIQNGLLLKGNYNGRWLIPDWNVQFDATATQLKVNTVYHVRAYAKNKFGIAYGEDRQFNM